ncbi:MAG: rhomboid family intramembrane serine protease [Euryarchaeota archaeon]|nr:rhomboid family intramembrane serine protease [Euryarchaeota archaeon]
MVDWVGLTAAGLMIAVVGFGWFRGWSMVQSLIVAMFGVFMLGVVTSPGLALSLVGSSLVESLAWRPAYIAPSAFLHWPTLVTTMFLHADAVHIVMNVVIFVFMGMGLEERIGRGRLLLVFLGGGIIGTLLHTFYVLVAAAPVEAFRPVVGASGGVFAVLAAYATLYPRDKVVLFFILILPNVPVYIAALVYTAMELVALEFVGGLGSGVARIAHIGGIGGGAFLAFLIMRIRPVQRGKEAGRPIDLKALESRIETPEQREIYDRFIANKDEPELARAWLERLADMLPCERCGSTMHLGKDTLRCTCGNRVRYRT